VSAPHGISRCVCGDEAIWGSEATLADLAAWRDQHATCAGPTPVELRGRVVRSTPPRLRLAVEELVPHALLTEAHGGVLLEMPTRAQTVAAALVLRDGLGWRATVGATERAILVRPQVGAAW
jgi:hypothetical protein